MDPTRLTRRELLRSIGVAGIAAWSAPVLMSSRASASVDRCRKKRSRKLCGGGFCDCYSRDGPCGVCSSDVGDGSYCFTRFGDLRCYCAEDVFCSEAGTCATDLSCKSQGLGDICITMNGCTGCGDSFGVCSTRCCSPISGSAPAPRPRRLGATASRR